jgi:hypothetical protein
MALLPYLQMLTDMKAMCWDTLQRLVPIGRRLDYIIQQQERLMSAIDDLRAAVAAERSVTQGVVTLLQDLNQRLHDAVNADDMAAVSAVVADIKANTDTLAAAVAANTPSSPGTGSPVTPEPSPTEPGA